MATQEFYNKPKLAPMPLFEQQRFTEVLEEFSLKRSFVGDQGSKLLGVNLIFTDAFLSSTVAVKYDVKGRFKAHHLYHFKKVSAYHFKVKDKWVALYFQNTSNEEILQMAAKLKAPVSSEKSYGKAILNNLSPISIAFAEECHATALGPELALNTQLGDQGFGAYVSRCLDGVGSGVKDSTVGVVDDTISFFKKGASFITKEAKAIYANPRGRLGDYANFVGEGLSALKEFAVTIGSMIKDPNYGKKILKQRFGEIGAFFSNAYDSIAGMPLNSKVDILCNLVGAIGTDLLITAVTAGAAGAKLGLTVSRLLFKLKKVAKLIGKGLSLPFKTISKLEELSLRRLEKVIAAGREKLLHKRIREMGCAI